MNTMAAIIGTITRPSLKRSSRKVALSPSGSPWNTRW